MGYQIPAGEAKGIRRGFPLVRDALKSLQDMTASEFTSTLQIGTKAQFSHSGADGAAVSGRSVTIYQYIYSEAKTAADLMREARYQAEEAVLFGV